MGNRFGRNQKRALKARIALLEQKHVGDWLYGNRRNIGVKWSQGYFVDSPNYRHWTQVEKEAANKNEGHLVRPSPTGNAICRCPNPLDAQWLAYRLNMIDNLISKNNALRDKVNRLGGDDDIR